MNSPKEAENAIKILNGLEGLGKEFIILRKKDRKTILSAKEGDNTVNRGIIEVLSRDIAIAFAHSEKFRKPPCAIVLLSCNGKTVGEMTDNGKKFYNGLSDVDTYILPPVPFPELDKFADVCSASPGYEADKYLRKLMKLESRDATLLVGFNIK